MKAKTTIRLRQKLKAPVSTVASGITSRGNWVLRTTPSWATTEVTAFVVDSWKKVKRTMPEQQQHRVVLDFFAADFEDLGEDEEQHPEQHQRPDQRPEVAEHGAEVDALELGHRHQPEQVEEAPRAAAEGRGPAHLRAGAQPCRLARSLPHPRSRSPSISLGGETIPREWASPPKTTKSSALWT